MLLERPACQPRLGLGTLTAFRAFHFQHRGTGLLFRLMFLLLLHGAPVSWFGPLFATDALDGGTKRVAGFNARRHKDRLRSPFGLELKG